MIENRSQYFAQNFDVQFNQMDNSIVENAPIKNGIARLPEDVVIPETNLYTNATPLKTIKAFSNRLAGVIKPNGTPGSFKTEKAGAGGLAAGLKAALVLEEGYGEPEWTGWPGFIKDYEWTDPNDINQEQEGLSEALRSVASDEQYKMNAIHLTKKEYDEYYLGYTNDRLWMLFHGFPEKSAHDWNNPEEPDTQWETTKQVNRKFAEHAVQNYQEGDRFWIHDYHLIMQAKYMREMMPDNDFISSFFLHIPFPEPHHFMLLPQDQQKDLMDGFLSNSSVFFQTPEDVRNFIETAKAVFGMDSITMEDDQNGNVKVGFKNRNILVGAKPIGIDADSFGEKANQLRGEIEKEKAEFIKQANGRKIAYSVARLDPSKGSPERIKAIDHILSTDPQIQSEGICLVEVVAPSRKGVKAYDELDAEIHQLTDEVNKKYQDRLGVDNTIQLYDKGIHNFTQLAALMNVADMAVITPKKDGYNLVQDENAKLKKPNSVAVYGKGAGATRGYENMAITVDGSSVASVAFGIIEAARILREQPELAEQWDVQMKQHLQNHNIRTWAQSIRKDGNL